jgi:feruloyl-CoA synthase
MLCSNQEAIAQLWPGVEKPPVLLDGLPWHDPVAGSLSFDLALRNGGVLYIDRGRPLPGDFDVTLANLSDVAPTMLSILPRAAELLIPALRRDTRLRKRFFQRLRLVACVGAAFPPNVSDALQALARETITRDLALVSWWGWPETVLASITLQSSADETTTIGLPIPGTEIKLVPVGDRFDACVRGPNVTPGYWKRVDLTARAFDQDGFFKTGAAVRFVDPARPEQGLILADRMDREFELAAGARMRQN